MAWRGIHLSFIGIYMLYDLAISVVLPGVHLLISVLVTSDSQELRKCCDKRPGRLCSYEDNESFNVMRVWLETLFMPRRPVLLPVFTIGATFCKVAWLYN